MVDPVTAPDARRTAGARTRRRLLDATRALLAARGEEAVSLREIVAAAGANVAAVSYHFGSKHRLCDAAIDEALRAVVDGQLERYAALAEGAPLDQLARAFAEPIVRGMSEDAETRALMRILARVVGDPGPRGRVAHAQTLARGTDVLLARLRALAPEATELELGVRIAGAGAILQAHVLDRLGADLDGSTPDEVERLLMPVVTGALAGGAHPR